MSWYVAKEECKPRRKEEGKKRKEKKQHTSFLIHGRVRIVSCIEFQRLERVIMFGVFINRRLHTGFVDARKFDHQVLDGQTTTYIFVLSIILPVYSFTLQCSIASPYNVRLNAEIVRTN